MGYTHYWIQVRDFTPDEWIDITTHIRAIVADAENRYEIRIANGAGERGTRAEFENDAIAFNGSGDDSHETFTIHRERPPKAEWQSQRGRDFCKTARKPYDVAVTASLCYLSSITQTHRVTSDGTGRDFLSGLTLARQALPALGNQLDLPMGVMENDRWCPPWFHMLTDSYRLSMCIDGHAYARRLDEPSASYRFHSHSECAQFAASHGDLFNAFGFFDDQRRSDLARRQEAVLKDLIRLGSREPAAEGRTLPPPAFVRPGEIPDVENNKSPEDILSLAEPADPGTRSS